MDREKANRPEFAIINDWFEKPGEEEKFLPILRIAYFSFNILNSRHFLNIYVLPEI